MSEINIPLVVDLDGTLTKSDTFVESLVSYIKENLLNIFNILYWAYIGKAYLKSKIADKKIIPPKEIIYRKEVIDYINEQRLKKRKVFLCSGSNIKQVEAIHNHLKIFDGFYGSTINCNLISKNKLDLIIKNFSPNKFDYIGDSKADIIIWNSSRIALTVDVEKKTLNKISNENSNIIQITKILNFKDRLKVFIKSIRAYQWVKNSLVFLPIFLAQDFSLLIFSYAFLAFISFSFVSSFTYLINDIFDINEDRHHKRKKNRPIAAGIMSISLALKTSIVLLTMSILIGLLILGSPFYQLLFIYVIVTSLYTIILKKILFFDIFILSFFYILRILGGGFATNIEISNWLILFSFVFFLFLASIKRLAEIINITNDDIKRNYGRAYKEIHLYQMKLLCILSAISSIIFLINYFFSNKVLSLYHNPKYLLLICPIIIIWQIVLFKNTLKNQMSDDPIIYIFKDKISWASFSIIALIIISQMRIW